MCGEHPRQRYFTTVQPGSSPHVRGARSVCRFGTTNCGIIPACAGSTTTRRRTSCTARDHPRMCGEHSDMPLHCDEITGSSPHVRGAHGYRFDAEKPWGIIPACAGSTGFSTDEKLHLRDHPRMCGEHVGHATCPFGDWGSSPHVRGARLTFTSAKTASGIIPACAGSTTVRHSTST